MAAGWRLISGDIRKYYVSESDLWAAFNYVFSNACKKDSTYKFGLIKSILDNLLTATSSDRGMEITYYDIFAKFAENYWNLITKYNLRQVYKSTRYTESEIEKIFHRIMAQSHTVADLEFENLSESDKKSIIADVSKKCKRCVVGALYENFEGQLYGFDLNDSGIWVNPVAFEFMLKYKPAIEQLNYYAWAKFLEKVNQDSELVGVIGKLELSTPKRSDLSIYRNILQKEFESDNCFYCGKKFKRKPHVDHVIPWSFVKDDYIWNFVLACPRCNERKNNKLPTKTMLSKVIVRNEALSAVSNVIVEHEFKSYDEELLWRIWNYAKLSGIKEMTSL